MASPEDPLGLVGATLAERYRVDRLVARGGSAIVYQGHHLGFDQQVAIKFLVVEADTAQAHARFVEAFLAEGRLLHRLSKSTADVVQALDVGVATLATGRTLPYLVLEWLEGRSLDDEIAARRARGLGGRSVVEAVTLLEPAARALAMAHGQGVVHRDVKPANLVLAEVAGRTTLKVVDFGIAKVAGAEGRPSRDFDAEGGDLDATRTTDSVVMFTPRYGAPEHFNKAFGTTGPWTDVYGLALCLVELVTGKRALEGNDPGDLYLATSSLSKRPTLRARGAQVSDAVEAVLQRALAVEPKRRHPDAKVFWAELRAALPELRPSSPPPRSELVPPSSASPVSSRRLREAPPPSSGREAVSAPGRAAGPGAAARATWPLLVGSAVALGAVGVAVGVLIRPPPSAPLLRPTAAELPAAARTPEPEDTRHAGPDGMVRIAAATFTMGSYDDGRDERPPHQVTLTRSFWLDATEVTADAYDACVAVGACAPVGPPAASSLGAARRDAGAAASCPGSPRPSGAAPVACVARAQAAAYCLHVGKRLPTEAEWELAARGGDGRAYPWGSELPTSCTRAVVRGADGACADASAPRPVGEAVAGASAAGALDLAGNVWEWVADDFSAYAPEALSDPTAHATGGGILFGVVRGGAFDEPAARARAAVRRPLPASEVRPDVGFRCATDAD